VTVLYFYEGAFTLWRRRMTGICERCGYADERSLRYLFTRATGLSPVDWRTREANSGRHKK